MKQRITPGNAKSPGIHFLDNGLTAIDFFKTYAEPTSSALPDRVVILHAGVGQNFSQFVS